MLIVSRCAYSTLGARAFATNWHRSACLPAKACCHGHQPKHVPNHKSASILANTCQTPNNGILMTIEYCNKSCQFLPLIQAQMIALPEPPKDIGINLRTLRLLHRSRKRKACLEFRPNSSRCCSCSGNSCDKKWHQHMWGNQDIGTQTHSTHRKSLKWILDGNGRFKQV